MVRHVNAWRQRDTQKQDVSTHVELNCGRGEHFSLQNSNNSNNNNNNNNKFELKLLKNLHKPEFSHFAEESVLPGLTSLAPASILASKPLATLDPSAPVLVVAPVLLLLGVTLPPDVPLLLLLDVFCSFEQEEEEDELPFCCCTMRSCFRNFARRFWNQTWVRERER